MMNSKRTFRDTFRSEQGMSIVQVLIAAGMMGGLALVVGQLGKNAANVTHRSNQSAEINEAYNRAQQYLLHSPSCQRTFQDASAIAGGKSTTVPSIWTYHERTTGPASEKEYFIVGEPVGKSSRVFTDSIKVNRTSLKEIEVEFYFNRAKIGDEKNIIIKRVQLIANFDGSNKIESCYSKLESAVETAAVTACNEVGGERVDQYLYKTISVGKKIY